MNSEFYTIECITNLHMGSGDINFNIIDNEVQRDPITGYPSMYSSGIKGALRQAFSGHNEEIDFFGSKPNEPNKEENESIPGHLCFLTANLLAMPVRSSDSLRPYYMVTTKTIIQRALEMISDIKGGDSIKTALNIVKNLGAKVAYGNIKEASIEGFLFKKKNKKNNVGGSQQREDEESVELKPIDDKIINSLFCNLIDKAQLLIIPDDIFKKINLPVIARNCLENGISKNLWYEEVVPYKSLFVFGILSDGTQKGDGCLGTFNEEIKKNSLIQFGGNATVGYGLTKVVPFDIGGSDEQNKH